MFILSNQNVFVKHFTCYLINDYYYKKDKPSFLYLGNLACLFYSFYFIIF
ncbi:hypothetical protein D928_02581 [Enterococcus faecalis 20-SD-BW-06]|nr:hypothetical protein D928_02581 [Enterococcus faecalis 20-SD-BW-06]EPI00718.1 hypothetical protein D919_01853 [Enterococcus faecalis 20-SD-BW-08]